MKKHYLLPLLFALLMSSCGAPANPSSSSVPSSEIPSSEPSSEIPSSSETPSSSEEPSSEVPSSSEEPRDYVFSFYNINDFHGHVNVEDTGLSSTYCPGVSTLAANLEELKQLNPEGYVFTNSGDMLQETYASYVSEGNVVSEVLDAMDCEAMSVGNHEFDWGLEPLMNNKQYLGDCALLGANVYYYDEVNDCVLEPALDKFDPYKIINRQGINIGIIGVIGEDQLTSITSTIWEGLTFVDPTDVIKTYAYELKEEHDCKIVLVLGHGGFNDFGGLYGCNAAITKEYKEGVRYIDGMFLGHTHKRENKKVNGVPFVQSYARGSQVSHIELTYNSGTGLVTCTKTDNINIEIDETKTHAGVQAVLDKYLDEDYYREANMVVGQITGDSTTVTRKMAGKFHAYAAYEDLKQYHDDIVLVGNNGGRADVNINDDNTVTREMLFRMNPFTNIVYVCEVLGADIRSNFGSYYCYYMPNYVEIEYDKYYKVALIDYILFHKNTRREYDKFPSLRNIEGEYDVYPCDTTINYLLDNAVIEMDFLTNDPGFSYLSM